MTKNLRRTPFYIISFGNAILLVVITALNDYCNNNQDAACNDKGTKVDVLKGLITIESMFVAFMWCKYIMTVKKFKKASPDPDIMRAEFLAKLGIKHTRVDESAAPSTSPPPASSEATTAVEPRDIKEVLELQSELLSFLCPYIGYEPDDRPNAPQPQRLPMPYAYLINRQHVDGTNIYVPQTQTYGSRSMSNNTSTY